MATQRSHTDLNALAGRVEAALKAGDPTGFLGRHSPLSEFAIILSGCIDLNPLIPESERQRIVQKVALSSSLPRPVTANVIIRECTRLEGAYLSRPQNRYQLLTGVSVQAALKIPSTTIDHVTITSGAISRRAAKHRAAVLDDAKKALGFEVPSNYLPVTVRLRARSTAEAAERGLEAIDVVRATWNLALNRQKSWRLSFGHASPVNDVRLLPVHTLHESSGKLAVQSFWYEPGYRRPASLVHDKKKWTYVLGASKVFRRRINLSPYQAHLKVALVRYVRALDSAELHDAFLKLWSLLEHLTDTTKAPARTTIKRAVFLFQDRELCNLVLSNLALFRNRYVHTASDSADIESLVFQLKQYVDALLIFHLGNRFGFSTIEETAQFLDMPSYPSDLKRLRRRVDQALRFVSAV